MQQGFKLGRAKEILRLVTQKKKNARAVNRGLRYTLREKKVWNCKKTNVGTAKRQNQSLLKIELHDNTKC